MAAAVRQAVTIVVLSYGFVASRDESSTTSGTGAQTDGRGGGGRGHLTKK